MLVVVRHRTGPARPRRSGGLPACSLFGGVSTLGKCPFVAIGAGPHPLPIFLTPRRCTGGRGVLNSHEPFCTVVSAPQRSWLSSITQATLRHRTPRCLIRFSVLARAPEPCQASAACNSPLPPTSHFTTRRWVWSGPHACSGGGHSLLCPPFSVLLLRKSERSPLI